MRRFLAIGTLALLVGHWPAGAKGGLVINIGGTNIAASGTGAIDVTVTGTSSLGDNLALTAFQFQIIPAGGTTSMLDFSPSQANSGLTSSNYVFFSNSGDVGDGQPLGVATTPTLYTGGDNTANFADVTVTSTTTFLLARLDLTAFTGLGSPKVGDSFTVSLVDNPSFTFFDDSQFNSTSFTAIVGDVTIVASVPEPSSAVLAMTGLAMAALFELRRRAASRVSRRA